uniref:Uncharacterized protein n=1 Tax=Leersia perrieri TaxID=77586 RepID=A0A0D9WMP6_9ORYZ
MGSLMTNTPVPQAAPPFTGMNGCSPTPLGHRPLHRRVAIVTGGSGGIGAAVTAHLVSLGARVVVGYVGDPAPADKIVAELNGSVTAGEQPCAVAVAADVSDDAQVSRLFDAAEAAFGPELHVLVAAAGVQDDAYPRIADTAPEQWDRAFAVNARGTFLCCREAARRLAAVEAMTKVLAKELAGTAITANSVAPGPVATPMFYAGKSEERIVAVAGECPMGRIGEPMDVAPVVGFLCSDAAEWINGQVIRVNGGYI